MREISRSIPQLNFQNKIIDRFHVIAEVLNQFFAFLPLGVPP
mgnify:CR=1 FL=1